MFLKISGQGIVRLLAPGCGPAHDQSPIKGYGDPGQFSL